MLAFDVARVFGGDVNLFDDGFVQRGGGEAGQGGKGRVVNFRALEQFARREVLRQAGQVLLADEGVAQAFLFARERFHFFVESAVAVFVHHAEFVADGSQAGVGVVFAQEQAVFGAAGEHAVGFACALGDEVVNEDAEVGLFAFGVPGFEVARAAGGVDAGEQALCARFFVAGGAVDLSGEVEVFDGAAFEAVFEVLWVKVVVFDGVAGAGDARLFEAGDGLDVGDLCGKGQAGGNAVRVEFVGGEAFGFDEDLVAVFVGKAHDFVFDGRAVARAEGVFDDTRVHRRLVDVDADDVVRTFVGAGDVAGDLARVFGGIAEVGKNGQRGVAGLGFHAAVINGACVQARRGAGFHAGEGEGQVVQARGEFVRGRVAGAATGEVVEADVDFAAEEGAGGEDGGGGVVVDLVLAFDAGDARSFEDEVGDGGLEEVKVGLVFDEVAHRRFVEDAVGLGAGGAHRRTFAAVEDAPLDAGAVGRTRHDAAEGVDFFDKVAFADAADGGVAAHLADGFDVVCQQQGACAHAGSSASGFNAGMATADNEDVVMDGVFHGCSGSCQSGGRCLGAVMRRVFRGLYSPLCRVTLFLATAKVLASQAVRCLLALPSSGGAVMAIL